MKLYKLLNHLKNGGKVRNKSWVNKTDYICLGDDGFFYHSQGGLYGSNMVLFEDGWEVYEKHFEIIHRGLYKTRDGRKAFVSFIDPNKKIFPIVGIIEGENEKTAWCANGYRGIDFEQDIDIVSEWKD